MEKAYIILAASLLLVLRSTFNSVLAIPRAGRSPIQGTSGFLYLPNFAFHKHANAWGSPILDAQKPTINTVLFDGTPSDTLVIRNSPVVVSGLNPSDAPQSSLWLVGDWRLVLNLTAYGKTCSLFVRLNPDGSFKSLSSRDVRLSVDAAEKEMDFVCPASAIAGLWDIKGSQLVMSVLSAACIPAPFDSMEVVIPGETMSHSKISGILIHGTMEACNAGTFQLYRCQRIWPVAALEQRLHRRSLESCLHPSIGRNQLVGRWWLASTRPRRSVVSLPCSRKLYQAELNRDGTYEAVEFVNLGNSNHGARHRDILRGEWFFQEKSKKSHGDGSGLKPAIRLKVKRMRSQTSEPLGSDESMGGALIERFADDVMESGETPTLESSGYILAGDMDPVEVGDFLMLKQRR